MSEENKNVQLSGTGIVQRPGAAEAPAGDAPEATTTTTTATAKPQVSEEDKKTLQAAWERLTPEQKKQILDAKAAEASGKTAVATEDPDVPVDDPWYKSTEFWVGLGIGVALASIAWIVIDCCTGSSSDTTIE